MILYWFEKASSGGWSDDVNSGSDGDGGCGGDEKCWCGGGGGEVIPQFTCRKTYKLIYWWPNLSLHPSQKIMKAFSML